MVAVTDVHLAFLCLTFERRFVSLFDLLIIVGYSSTAIIRVISTNIKVLIGAVLDRDFAADGTVCADSTDSQR